MKKLFFLLTFAAFFMTISAFAQKVEAKEKASPVITFTIEQHPTGTTGGEVVLQLFWLSQNNAKKTIVIEFSDGQFIVIDASKSGSEVIYRHFNDGYASIIIDGYGPNGSPYYHQELIFNFDSLPFKN